MKHLLLSVIVFSVIFSCSGPSSPKNSGDEIKDYSIIFNHHAYCYEHSCALAITDKEGNTKHIGEGMAPASERTITFSDDGSKVLYLTRAYENGKSVVVLTDVDNLTDTFLDLGDNAVDVKISPDGKYIAYFYASYGNSDSTGIYVMNVDQSNNHLLINYAQIQVYIDMWVWSEDSKGINYEIFSPDLQAYFIDKDGLEAPVEIDLFYVPYFYDPEDLIHFSLEGFDRAGLPDGVLDSLSFAPGTNIDEIDRYWTLYRTTKYEGRISIDISYLLGYDFNAKTERFLIDTTITTWDIIAYQSPDNEYVAVLTQQGLYLSQYDGTNKKIVDYPEDRIYSGFLRWIASREYSGN